MPAIYPLLCLVHELFRVMPRQGKPCESPMAGASDLAPPNRRVAWDTEGLTCPTGTLPNGRPILWMSHPTDSPLYGLSIPKTSHPTNNPSPGHPVARTPNPWFPLVCPVALSGAGMGAAHIQVAMLQIRGYLISERWLEINCFINSRMLNSLNISTWAA